MFPPGTFRPIGLCPANCDVEARLMARLFADQRTDQPSQAFVAELAKFSRIAWPAGQPEFRMQIFGVEHVEYLIVQATFLGGVLQ